MEYLIEYGMFLAKVVTLVLAVIVILIALASVGNRQRKGAAKGHIKVTKINDQLDEMLDSLKKAVLDKHRLKLDLKSRKSRRRKTTRSTGRRKKWTRSNRRIAEEGSTCSTSKVTLPPMQSPR